jgi:hypothetical protein
MNSRKVLKALLWSKLLLESSYQYNVTWVSKSYSPSRCKKPKCQNQNETWMGRNMVQNWYGLHQKLYFHWWERIWHQHETINSKINSRHSCYKYHTFTRAVSYTVLGAICVLGVANMEIRFPLAPKRVKVVGARKRKTTAVKTKTLSGTSADRYTNFIKKNYGWDG